MRPELGLPFLGREFAWTNLMCVRHEKEIWADEWDKDDKEPHQRLLLERHVGGKRLVSVNVHCDHLLIFNKGTPIAYWDRAIDLVRRWRRGSLWIDSRGRAAVNQSELLTCVCVPHFHIDSRSERNCLQDLNCHKKNSSRGTSYSSTTPLSASLITVSPWHDFKAVPVSKLLLTHLDNLAKEEIQRLLFERHNFLSCVETSLFDVTISYSRKCR